MRIEKTISTVDLHTAGEPVRAVLGGIRPLPGKTVEEKQTFFSHEMDFVRTMLMYEPRGHKDMCGAVMIPPLSPDANFGLIFFDGGGYLDMCGHSTMGVATAVIELGMFEKKEPVTLLSIDTPAGLVKAEVHVEDGQVRGVTIRNVASFLFAKDIELEITGIGEVKVDIAFGGNFFALVDAADFDLTLEKRNINRLITVGLKIREAVNKKIKVQHPIARQINSVGLTEIFGNTKNQQAMARNVVVFGNGQFDRSPCGTGTSAKLATLYAKGQIGLNEPFIYESIIETLFEGKIVGLTKVGKFEAIIPEITGSAYVTGFNQFIVNSEDPIKHGFQF
ncbi:MAG: proline racemase family protein [Candidatus Hermodarchaeota archaeon]|nr:proline racemase family protein [Candidatus Hermodarchaeota archaeon]